MMANRDRGQVAFPRELQERAIAARDLEEIPERWMHVVIRRQNITRAVGKIVYVSGSDAWVVPVESPSNS